MLALQTRGLTDQEIASDSPNRSSFVSVVQASADCGTLAELMNDSAFMQKIQNSYAVSGAVLLRGFPIQDTAEAEMLLSAWGTTFDDEYLGGASPRSRLSDHFFTSTEAPPSYVISFHTEMCYLKQRPGKIFFYCLTQPSKYGETPIFDCAAIYSKLSPAVRQKIDEHGMIYERYFGTRKARFFNVYKTWRDAFHADTVEQAELACQQQGLEYEWQSNGGLITRARMPGYMTDPTSGKRCISLTLYNGEAAPYDLSTFAHRLNPIKRLALSTFIRSQYAKKHVFMRTLWGDGSAISRAETRELIDAAWSSSNLFKWQSGDLLILDNIRCGHGRLNVVKPRKIAAALGDPYQI
ncbi:TauD/TfdA family dioxygenase [Arenicella xantha]|uniref:Alpha-ketoglutarate-dependent taurine dioxygenase n=1 Tax=Arenicella xantha TaxID=644221 RepID=A0A395JIS7_9GAMM|nr:TauD/TfdA family dioxygenase [Arenicella xantha]RBP49669.1 alpha-ketoglutarate-dependent taurine dioxygenase [Arenicella xantha]